MRVRVDPDKCQGHNRCIVVAPEVFTADELGYSHVKAEEVGGEFVACDVGVEEDVRALVRGTFLEGAPIVRTSSVTGEGLDALREAVGPRTVVIESLQG